jgi:hypothetical protein
MKVFLFYFFELATPNLGPAWNDSTQNSRSWLGGAESRLNGQSLMKKWCVTDPKIIFAKNQELVLLPLKCKPTPLLAKTKGACAKSKIYLRRVSQWNESCYVYPRWSIIYAGCCAQLSILRFGNRFTKKTRFRYSKNQKIIFRGKKWKSASMVFLAIPMATRVSYMALFRQTMPWAGPNLAHLT